MRTLAGLALFVVGLTACAAPPAVSPEPLAIERVLPSPPAPPAPTPAPEKARDPVAQARYDLHVRLLRQARDQALALQRDPGRASEAAAVLERVDARLVVRADRLGLVLPLSGPHRALGARLQAVMELAVPADGPELVVADTKGTEAGAAAAVEQLALSAHVVGLAGPVGDRESLAAAWRAAELEVPLVSVASREGLAAVSPWVFTRRFGPEAQARAVARYAIDVLGHGRFAVVHPDDAFGRRAARAFWESVESSGGEVTGAASYAAAAGSTAYDQAVRAVIGGVSDDARGAPFEVGEGKFKGYRPIVDFDAIYVPDHPVAARQVLRHLAFYDVAVRTAPGVGPGRDPETGRDVFPVQVLGPAAWNEPSIARGRSAEVQNSVFPDVFDPHAPEPVVRSFVRRFSARHGRRPTSMEAQAYDTMRWLVAAWRRAGAKGRKSLRRALGAGLPNGVTGPVRVDADGQSRMSPHFFTVSGSDVVLRKTLGRRGRP